MRKLANRIGGTAKDVAGNVAPTARQLGGRAKEIGGTIGGKAKDLQGAASPKVRQARSELARRTKDGRRKVGYWIAGEEPKKGRSGVAAAAAVTGAAVAFFLDPTNGKRRRRIAVDWIGARIRGVGQRTAGMGRGVNARAEGLRQRVLHLGDGQAADLNDPTLEQKVQSELFQGLDLPSKEISIMVANGVVSLRGTVTTPDLIAEIESRVRRIDGVRDVENQLRLHDAAPTR